MHKGRRPSRTGLSLRFQPTRADTERMTSVCAHGDKRASAARSRERGQAMVEFALLAPVFLLIVAGIIQFGVALNFWFDMQRVANQGARWAVVNCGPPTSTVCDPTLQTALENDVISFGNNPTVEICMEQLSGTSAGMPEAAVGDPVTVRLTDTFEFVPIVGIGSITLRGSATMRIEQKPTRAQLGSLRTTQCPP